MAAHRVTDSAEKFKKPCPAVSPPDAQLCLLAAILPGEQPKKCGAAPCQHVPHLSLGLRLPALHGALFLPPGKHPDLHEQRAAGEESRPRGAGLRDFAIQNDLSGVENGTAAATEHGRGAAVSEGSLESGPRRDRLHQMEASHSPILGK